MTGGTLEQRLGGACDLAHVLLDRGAEPAERQAEAFALWERSPFPSAAFLGDGLVPRSVNAAWRVVFGAIAIPVAVLTAVGQVAQSCATVHLSEVALDAGAAPQYCAVTVRQLRGGHGVPDGVIVVCAVTTDTVIARRLDVGASVLVWSAQIAGSSPWSNECWRVYTGASGADESWQRAIHADDLPRCVHALQEAVRLRSSSEVEARIRRGDDMMRWHRIKFITDAAMQRWFGTAADNHDQHMAIDERTELLARALAARADAEQANRLKDQFLATVSHELRAPMTTMLLWEKVLRDDTVKPDVRAQALAAIHESAVTQARLVSDLLDVARAISGKLFVDLRPVDLSLVCREAVAAIGPAAVAKQIVLVPRGAEARVEVQGDHVRLRQVVDNLLSNAVSFTDSGGTVTVELQRSGRRVSLQVTDTGRGVSPVFLPHLFEAFSQTDDALTRERGGLGLGLAIVKQLVELHLGTVEAQSAGRGLGTTFRISLPIASAPRVASSPAGIASSPSLAGVRVLVVDDDPRVRDALEQLLARAGATVDIAASAEGARTEIAAHPPSVIVCDIAMPGEDGYSFARSLRASGSELPAIALTAHAMAADAARAIAAGFDRHLAKPIDFEHLVTNLLSMLAERARPIA
ncbi:hypothetical protein BH11MYX3_BH11MYX3_15290 [soil metagenome]